MHSLVKKCVNPFHRRLDSGISSKVEPSCLMFLEQAAQKKATGRYGEFAELEEARAAYDNCERLRSGFKETKLLSAPSNIPVFAWHVQQR